MKCFICKYKGPQWVQFAPTYATLSMGFHEIELYAIIRNKFTLPVSNYFEQNWKRFLDDCFAFLTLSLIKPNKLLDND